MITLAPQLVHPQIAQAWCVSPSSATRTAADFLTVCYNHAMNVILYMAITVNGFIAKENDDTSYNSPEDWNSYQALIARCGNIIIGRRTYEQIPVDADFQAFLKKNKTIIVVLSSNASLTTSLPNCTIFNGTLQGVIDFLKNKGLTEALISGGGKLNASFMKEGLIDELYIDVEPIVFGKGIPLFSPSDFEQKLTLLGTKMLNASTIQLHYKPLSSNRKNYTTKDTF